MVPALSSWPVGDDLALTKDQAQAEAIRRWRELPISNQTTDMAMEFAKVLFAALEFETLGDRQKIITAWLIRDVQTRQQSAQVSQA